MLPIFCHRERSLPGDCEKTAVIQSPSESAKRIQIDMQSGVNGGAKLVGMWRFGIPFAAARNSEAGIGW